MYKTSPKLERLSRLLRFWPSYFIATIGIFFSFYLLNSVQKNPDGYIKWLISVHEYHPYALLLFSLALSFQLAGFLATIQVAKKRAKFLKKVNADLQNEVAERQSAEETKEKLEIALLQGQKLQAMGTLAGGIAHDFNNLLYAIIGYVELARDDIPKNEIAYKNLGKVLEASHRGQELIGRILSFSRRQHHHFEKTNLKTTIEAVLSLLRATIPASVLIEFIHLSEISIFGNQTQLHQVLVNIINNAVDAMDGEGNIIIRLSHIEENNPVLKQIKQLKDKKYCMIEITDNGQGMNQITIDRIFEPFFTTKEVGKGTGLGLSIVHSIIKEHDGDIIVQSKLGQGSIFKLIFPEYIEP